MNQMRAKDLEKKRNEQMKAFERISDVMFQLDSDCDKRISLEEMEEGACNHDLSHLFAAVDLPHGFTFNRFHTMLDLDGSGHLSKSEFIHGMMRLVHSNEFQRDCLQQLCIGQIVQNQFRLHREVKEDMRRHFANLRHEITALHRQSCKTSATEDSFRETRSSEKSELAQLRMIEQSELDRLRMMAQAANMRSG